MVKLKYINTMTECQIFNTGLKSAYKIEELYSTKVNRKVIIRIDLVKYLTCYFDEESVTKYRHWLLAIAQDRLDTDKLRQGIYAFLEVDDKFKKSINKIYQDCPYDMSFGKYIPRSFANVMIDNCTRLSNGTVGTDVFPIIESDGYLYMSVPDDESYIIPYSDYEVISVCKKLAH